MPKPKSSTECNDLYTFHGRQLDMPFLEAAEIVGTQSYKEDFSKIC